MKSEKKLHSLCRWTFHGGRGAFVPGGMRPSWDELNTAALLELITTKIAPRIPDSIQLGLELHYDTEVNEHNAAEVADALVSAKMYLAMICPSMQAQCGYGGPASLDAAERERADTLMERTVDIVYGPLRKSWHPESDKAPTLVIGNSSCGYDLATLGVGAMYQNLKSSVASLCKYEDKKGGKLYIGIEPKPNQGHPAMLLPTVASVLLFWKKLEMEFGINIARRGVNKEFGHSEMIGLDQIFDTVEELDHDAVVHMHLNSQGYNDGITMGGPGKYDIDHGTKINGFNITVARLVKDGMYRRWHGHDMQVRPYDNEAQGVDRIIRSILSWEACEKAAAELPAADIVKALSVRETGRAEDMMRQSLVRAHQYFDELYR